MIFVAFKKDEHFKKEPRRKGHFRIWKEEKGKNRMTSKNGNKKFCNHCKVSGHGNKKC